jgi:hypothetical protein
MTNNNIRNLACAITMQAVRDYFNSAEKGKKAILADLRSKYMDFITNGTSVAVADQLELHPDEIRERMQRQLQEE